MLALAFLLGLIASVVRDSSSCRWASLAPPTALALGGVWLSDAESGGAGAHWGNLWAESGGVTLGGQLGMLLLDAVLCAALGVYLDCVLPREWGTRLHPLFFLHPTYWRRAAGPGSAWVAARLTGGGREEEVEESGRERLEGEWTTEGDEDSLLEAAGGGEAEVRAPTARAAPNPPARRPIRGIPDVRD